VDSREQIRQRDSHLKSHGRFTLMALVFLGVTLVLSLFANLALIFAFNSYPKTTFLWTKDVKAVCEAVPLTEPNISQALLADFANRAAVSVHTYSYINWRESLTYATQEYFTPVGGRTFLDAFAASRILREVQRSYYVVSAVSSGVPVVEKSGVENGRYFWKVQVPITITYRQNSDYKGEDRIIEVTLVRIDPSPANPNGVAVDGFVSLQRTRTKT
jgi:intracellular multiplication protein IcmL